MNTYATATTQTLHAEQAPTRLALARWLPTGARVGRFTLHFLEMVVVMMVGMMPYHALIRALPPEYAVWFARGTTLYRLGMALSMALPMLPWMKVRGHGWRSGAEMALAMLAPTAVVLLLCWLGLDQGQPWVRNADGPGMLLAMLGLMLCRREHYTGGHSHQPRHAAHRKQAPTTPRPTRTSRPYRTMLSAVIGVLALLAAGCGRAAVPATPASSVSLEEHETADAQVVQVRASEFGFTPNTIQVAAGMPVRLVLTNGGLVEHDIQVDKLPATGIHVSESAHGHGNLVAAHAEKGAQAWVEFTPTKAGTYDLSCTISGHKAAGMKGKLVVV